MNQEEINKIQKVIDNHRKKMFVTCVETCPCWNIQNIIIKWENRHKKILASPSDNNDLIQDCHNCIHNFVCRFKEDIKGICEDWKEQSYH